MTDNREELKPLEELKTKAYDMYCPWDDSKPTVIDVELLIDQAYELGKQETANQSKNYRDGICYICKKETFSGAGNPARWPLHLEYVGGNGKRRVYHNGCIIKILGDWNTRANESSWVSVREKMPPKNKTVLSYDITDPDFSYEFNVWDGHSYLYPMTHWQPLPHPPKN